MTTISNKAMLSNLKISQWTARKLDKKATQEVATNHGTSADVGRYNKALIAKDSLAAIAQAAGAARDFHYANTLPWMDDGARILPSANFLPYHRKMQELRHTFESEVRKFIGSYADFVNDARIRLNGLFNESDYPTEADLLRRFGFDVATLPLPQASDFRVGLSDAEEARIRDEIEQRTNAAIAGAVKDTWNRVHEVVAKMAERLRAYNGSKEGAFRDSLVENVRDLVDLLPRLNVTGDAALDATAQRMKAELCAHDAQELREDANTRRRVADEAGAILADMMAQMSGYAGEAPQAFLQAA